MWTSQQVKMLHCDYIVLSSTISYDSNVWPQLTPSGRFWFRIHTHRAFFCISSNTGVLLLMSGLGLSWVGFWFLVTLNIDSSFDVWRQPLHFSIHTRSHGCLHVWCMPHDNLLRCLKPLCMWPIHIFGSGAGTESAYQSNWQCNLESRGCSGSSFMEGCVKLCFFTHPDWLSELKKCSFLIEAPSPQPVEVLGKISGAHFHFCWSVSLWKWFNDV